MSDVRLGIDVVCRADHQASLSDERGEFVWLAWRCRTTPMDLERLWVKRNNTTKQLEGRMSRRRKEPTEAAPASGPSIAAVPRKVA